MVGIGRGAELGILVKRGEALETAGRLTRVVFDKTGTLTSGKPEVSDVVALAGTEDDVLRAAAALERNSLHPLGEAMLRAAAARGLAVPRSRGSTPWRGRG